MPNFSLDREQIKKIVDIQLRHVRGRLQEQGYQLEITEQAKAHLAEVGYEPVYGARPLKRAIQRELQDPLAMEMLSGEIKPGDIIRVDRGPDGLTFQPIASSEVLETA